MIDFELFFIGVCFLVGMFFFNDAKNIIKEDVNGEGFFFFALAPGGIGIFYMTMVVSVSWQYYTDANYPKNQVDENCIFAGFLLALLRLAVWFINRIYVYQKNKQEEAWEIARKIQAKKDEEKKIESSEEKEIERELFEKINKKSSDTLLLRVRKEASRISPFLDESIAEVVEALRSNAHEIYNNFIKGQVGYKDLKTTMEEIISDLVVVGEMVNPSINQITYHDLLGVSINAKTEEIKQSYRDIMKIIHPDVARRNGANIDKANSLAEIVNTAYNNLK